MFSSSPLLRYDGASFWAQTNNNTRGREREEWTPLEERCSIWAESRYLGPKSELRGAFGHKIQPGSSSLITPDIFKQLGWYESSTYPLQWVYGSLISDQKWLSDRPNCRVSLVNAGTTQKHAWKLLFLGRNSNSLKSACSSDSLLSDEVW